MTMTTEPEAQAPDEPEVEHPEVLPATRPPAETEAPHGVRTAIDAAAEAAIANPGMPGRDEFLNLAAQARMLHLSGGAPELIRKDPYLAFHVVLVGRDLGISPSAAMALIDVIPSKNGPQLSLSPQLLNGQIRRLGLGSIVPLKRTEREAVAVALGPDGSIDTRCRQTWPDHIEGCTCRGILGDSEFTWDDAQMANLAGKGCAPGSHSATSGGSSGCGCNQGYRTYPKRMMWWRAAGFAADDYFPEAGLGLYSPEELGAVVDADGRSIDVSNVELPPGFQPAAPTPPEEADPADIWDLQERIASLPEEAKATLRERWAERIHLDNGRAIPPWALDAKQVKMARALLNGAEAQARALKLDPRWDADAARVETRAAVARAICAALGLALPEPQDPGPPEGQDAGNEAGAQPSPPAGIDATEPQSDEGTFSAAIAHATEEQVDLAIGRVKILKAHDVDKELTRLRQHTEGEINERRRRLGLAYVYETLHGQAPPEQIS